MNSVIKTKNNSPQSAFTIIELLVVVVIIGILATIVIVFYTGTRTKAIDTSLQSDLKSASTQLELDKAANDLYPSTKEEANGGKGLKPSTGTTFDYIYSSGSNTYCLTATKEDRSYYLDSTNRFPRVGTCQTGSFARTWGGTGADSAEDITNTSDGGYVVAGFTRSFGAGDADAYIAKYTADGTVSWVRTWSGADLDMAASVIQTSDGGYMLAGETYSYGAGGRDAFIAKYTADGTLSWSRTWGSTVDDDSHTIIQTSSGGYMLTGDTNGYGAGGLHDAYIASFTSDGTLSWSKTWGGAGNDWGFSVIQTSEGGYAISGETESYGAGGRDAFIAKYTADGTLSWSRTWGGTSNDYRGALIQSNDEGYLMAGDTKSYDAGCYDVYIAKYTNDGTLSWSKTWGGIDCDGVNALIKTSDNGYAIAGTIESVSTGGVDAFMIKYTNDGILSWNRAWGGTAHDGFYGLAQSNDSGYVTAGQTASFGVIDYDSVLVKFDSSGSISNCPSSMCYAPTATITSPMVTSYSPAASTSSPTAITKEPVIASQSPTATMTDPIAIETAVKPPMTVNFTSQELYITYTGINQSTCKEWTVPNGKQVKGFKVSQITEAGYDFFSVFIDGVKKYDMSGIITDKYIDTSATPGTVLKACLYTDEGTQDGYGGEVTGVIYN